MFVVGALAMPAHWYYDIAALQRDYGTIRDYQAPKEHHPNSIMTRASTGRAGRGDQTGDIVGGVILKGKKAFWGRPHRHYHHGLRAGDNTLNLLCVRVLIRAINAAGHYAPADFLRDYIAFMTTPDSHNDTYAESYHRDFFARYAQGIPPERCAGAEGHDTASIGGLVGLPPVIFTTLGQGDAAAVTALLTHLRLTHRSATLERYAVALGDLLMRVLQEPVDRLGPLACATAERLGFPATAVVERSLRNRSSDLDVIGKMLSPACSIDQSFPAVLYLAARYTDDIEAALIANANAGGDNSHRGAVLGAILGAGLGFPAIPERWIQGLQARAELESEIETFIKRVGEANPLPWPS
ncbi:MAG: ADP-ribosylglycohydrolase family protein [Candidatus Competibacteraceae bacterium]|nr:ADP-ribosylglycohydrolase family protein [Candidatus Competibacteraceae bacterium]